MRFGRREKGRKGGGWGIARMVLFYIAMCRSVYIDARSFFLSSHPVVHNHKYPNSRKRTPNKSPAHLLYISLVHAFVLRICVLKYSNLSHLDLLSSYTT